METGLAMELLDYERIRPAREAMGLSIAEAARRAGMKHRQAWYEVEAGKQTNVTLERLAQVAAVIGLRPRDLVKDVTKGELRAWLAERERTG